jgi:hypothetical protein
VERPYTAIDIAKDYSPANIKKIERYINDLTLGFAAATEELIAVMEEMERIQELEKKHQEA